MTVRRDADNDNDSALPERRPWNRGELDRIPDVRDGLTRLQRTILYVLHAAKKDFGERHVPTATLYGRVVEYVDVSVDEFQRELARLTGRGGLR